MRPVATEGGQKAIAGPGNIAYYAFQITENTAAKFMFWPPL